MFTSGRVSSIAPGKVLKVTQVYVRNNSFHKAEREAMHLRDRDAGVFVCNHNASGGSWWYRQGGGCFKHYKYIY